MVGDMTGQRRHTVAGEPPAAHNQQYWQLWAATDFDRDNAVDLRHLVDVITARRPPSCPNTRSLSGYPGRCGCIAWSPSGLYTLTSISDSIDSANISRRFQPGDDGEFGVNHSLIQDELDLLAAGH
jgi:hypothetical protein